VKDSKPKVIRFSRHSVVARSAKNTSTAGAYLTVTLHYNYINH